MLLLLCADDPSVSDPAIVQVCAGKLFVVGDPKQAIYRFRRADVAIYEAVKQRLLDQGARLVHLTTSFRSVPSIQSAVNAAFEPIMRGDGQAYYVPLENDRTDITGDLATRLVPDAGEGSAGELAARVDDLLARVREASSAGSERESVMRRLLESMHEAMAVDRNGIALANARFAELCGAANPVA